VEPRDLPLLDGRPFGLAQRSRIADHPDELAGSAALAPVPPETMTIDHLIGGPRPSGRGLGTRMIRSLVAATRDEHPRASGIVVAATMPP
jgi:aminoglycoside 6'-N-acetyltransferase